jgi:kinesin family protein 3/17
MSKKDEAVKVIVRIRPLGSHELRSGFKRLIFLHVSVVYVYFYVSVVDVYPQQSLISVRNPKMSSEPPKDYTFDAVFGPDSQQKDIYDMCIADAVDSVLNGYNATVFAYGQVSCT